MRWTRAVDGAGSLARVWRAEGLAAVRDRVWDRARDAVIRARCVHGGREPWPAAPILNVIGIPMTAVFGGVPLQLRARLRRESLVRPVALLSRAAGRRPDGPGAAATTAAANTATAAASRAASSRVAAAEVADRATADGADGGWRLEWWSGGRPRRAMTFPAGAWDGDPLRDDPAWLHAARTCARLVNARAIHVENAAGLSLVSLSELMGAGAPFDESRVSTVLPVPLPVVLSVHDLSLFSRHPHVPHAHADSDESPVDHRQRFEHAFHHALGTSIVRAAAFTIYPSHFMRHRIEALPHHPAHVVAPGIEPPARASRSARWHDQIALLGGGQEHKGGPRLARIAAMLAARGMQVTSYGGYGHEHLLQMRGIAGVRVRGYYRAGSLPELLARQGASLALILSAVPESFSLVLSEAWAAGVPVIAPASGAFAERLRSPDASAPHAPAPHATALHATAPQATAPHAPGPHAPAPHAPAPHAPASHTTAPYATGPHTTGPHETGAPRSPMGPRCSDPTSGWPSDEEAVRAGGLLVSADPSDEEILAAVDRARRMPWAALQDGLPAPPTAAQAAERHIALYRDAGFMADPAGA